VEENDWQGLLSLAMKNILETGISDRWFDLFYDSVVLFASLVIPPLAIFFTAKLFGIVSTDLKDFIAQAMKLEFTTEIGRINLYGLLLLFFFLAVFCTDMEGSIKAFCFGISMFLSLIITYLANKRVNK
jgi:hypothetical protein